MLGPSLRMKKNESTPLGVGLQSVIVVFPDHSHLPFLG